jgi:D-glycero-alpha-D-manno-heptose-7-phosphate kinase
MAELLADTARTIVTRTPLRIGFAGGGTDLAAFYEKEDGAVFSTAITRYVHVTVKRHSELFLEPIRLNYSQSEQVNSVDEIANNIARESLRFLDIEPPIYISTVGDVPASTGLGGSGAFAVGLLNALHAFRNERVSAGQLAEEASHIEIEVLGEPIGKQDQYAAAFGGCNVFCFRGDGSVTVEHQSLKPQMRRELFGSMMLFWTGHQRDASAVLSEQRANTSDRFRQLQAMRDEAYELRELVANGHLDVRSFGRVLHEGWLLKRQLASSITNDRIDEWYERAMGAGSLGGKLCGAGGGGFLLFIVPQERHGAVRDELSELWQLEVEYEPHGSQLMVPFGS